MTETQFRRVLDDNRNLAQQEALRNWVQGWAMGFATASCLAFLYILWCLGGHVR